MRWSGRRLRGFGSLCTGRVSETGWEKGKELGGKRMARLRGESVGAGRSDCLEMMTENI